MTTETKTTYTLIMCNSQGAAEETRHLKTKIAVREQIRTWNAKNMTAMVIDSNGVTVYEGPALSF